MMKAHLLRSSYLILASFSLVFMACAASDSGNSGSAQDSESTLNAPIDTWPRQLKAANGTIYTIYQPQVDSWDDDVLSARSAVSVQQTGDKAPTYGILFLSVQTQTDKQSRTVSFEKITVSKVLFPSAEDKAAGWLTQLRSLAPTEMHTIALDRLEASLAITSAKKSETQPLRNDPPEIVFSAKPALLILLDGNPQWRPISGSNLQRAINTHALLLKTSDGKMFLHLWDGYVESMSLKGPWKPADQLPSGIAEAQSQLTSAKQVDLLAGQKDPNTGKMPSLTSTPLPDLILATKPTEVVVTSGDPKWTPIEGTNLLYVSNTPAHVFKETSDQQTYILLSGRWFKSSGFNGPWAYVSSSSLPGDFAKIPDNSPQENVKASIPGTPQATEAVIANSIPQSTKIERAKAVLSPAPVYDGTNPQWGAIEGTPLHYAVNSTTPVIQVDSKSFFACQNGVWFAATAPNGPWAVATSVPAVIYTIPPSCPVYYVTFVRIYRFDDTYVWTGYTPGYYGAYITPDGVVVYGTGYYYAPYTGTTVYVAYPITYGYDSTLCWTPWAGWYFGFAAGWAWGSDWYYWNCYPPAPYWGPYWPYCYGWGYNEYGGITAWGPYGWAGTSGDIYHNNGPWSSVSRAAGGYDSITGNQWATQYGHAYNSTTGTKIAGQRGAVENVYTGNYAYGSRGVAYNQNSGAAAWGQHSTFGNENSGKEISGGHGGFYNPNTGQVTHIAGAHGADGGVLDVNGNVYAGKDGHVYQHNSDGSWTQLSRPAPGQGGSSTHEATPVSGNNRTEPSRLGQDGAGQRQEIDRASLERERAARESGFSRTEGFQRSRSTFSRGGFGGGGFHGGFRR